MKKVRNLLASIALLVLVVACSVKDPSEDYTPEITRPILVIESPTNHEKIGQAWFISGTVEDTSYDNCGMKSVYLRIDASPFMRGYIYYDDYGTLKWDYFISNLTYGLHTLYVYAENSNNVSSLTNSLIVERTSLPSVAITNITNMSATSNASIFLAGVAYMESPYVIQKVELSVNGEDFLPVSYNSTLKTWNTNIVLSKSGINILTVRATGDNNEVSEVSNKIMYIEKKKWTVMVYLDGDNNLEDAAIQDVNEMEYNPGLTNGNLNVIVLMDRAPGYSTADGDWKGTRLYQIQYDPNGVDSTIRSTRLAGMGLSDTGDSDELNMADPANVTAFVDYVKTYFPATNNMIIFWNHGGGWRAPAQHIEPTYQQEWKKFDVQYSSKRGTSRTFTQDLSDMFAPTVSHPTVTLNQPTQNLMKEICVDETSGGDVLNNSEVRTALTGEGIKVIGFDACLMGMFETAYELRSVADYMVGSADSEPDDGWEYNQWINGFLSSGMTTGDLLTNIVNAYATRYSSTAATTMAAYDLSKMDTLMTAFNSYVTELSNNLWNAGHTNRASNHFGTVVNNTEQYVTYKQYGQFHTDVWDLADKLNMASSSALKTAIDNVVVDEWHNPTGTITTGDPNSHGMALYFGTIVDTNGNLGLLNDYAYSNFTLFNQDSAWDSYLVDLYAFPPFTWIGDGVTNTSSLTNKGYDLYQFNIAQSGGILIDLTNYGANDFDLDLYDSSSEIAHSWVNDPHESISTNLSPGWYILRVSSYSGASSYDVSLTSQGATIR